MKYIYTSEQAKAIDTHAIQKVGFPSLVLMEKAAMAVATRISSKHSKLESVLCICGTGNNGGDGIAVARILKQAGYQSAIYIVGEESSMTEDCKTQLKLATNCRVPVLNTDSIEKYDILVDAIFGIGLARPVTDIYEHVIGIMNKCNKVIYSVDVPSGINGSTGQIMGVAVNATETITFGIPKIGLLLFPGCGYAGEVSVCDIGLPGESVKTITNPAYIYDQDDLSRLPFRSAYSNKGTFGKVLVIAGCETMSGACYFSAKAAYLMGAGLVKVMTTENNRDILLTSLPEVIYADYESLDESLEWADVVVLGPGIGLSERAKALVDKITENCTKPLILDGDALTILGKRKLNENVIVTPHVKEMTRLTGLDMEEIQGNMIGVARGTSDKNGYIVCLKDARSVVSDGDEAYVNTSGNNGMATGGSGDVLAGVIAGLVAGIMMPFEAAKLGTYIHGLAGDIMAEKKGYYGLLASDILEGLSIVTREERN